MLNPAATIGLLASAAVPAFEDYMEKSKRAAQPTQLVAPTPEP